MKLFVICLDKEKERRAFMESQLEALGLTAVFAGVSGETLPPDIACRYNEALAKARFGRPLANAELGCYASHLRVWQAICENNIPAAVVMESDAELPEDFVNIIQRVMRANAPWEVVKLYWSDCLPSYWSRESLDTRYQLVRSVKKSYGTVAYVIRQSGARKLMRWSHEISFPVDVFLSGGRVKKQLSCYSIYPRAVNHLDKNKEQSLIEAQRRAILEGLSLNRAEPRQKKMTTERQLRFFFHKMAPPPDL